MEVPFTERKSPGKMADFGEEITTIFIPDSSLAWSSLI